MECRHGPPPKRSGPRQSCSAWPLPPLPGLGDACAAPDPHRVRHDTVARKLLRETGAGGGAGTSAWLEEVAQMRSPGPRPDSQLLNRRLPEGESLAVARRPCPRHPGSQDRQTQPRPNCTACAYPFRCVRRSPCEVPGPRAPGPPVGYKRGLTAPPAPSESQRSPLNFDSRRSWRLAGP